MRQVTVAAIQMQMDKNSDNNLIKAEKMVREAASQGANVILLPELFENLYFCQEKRYEYYDLAETVDNNPAVKLFSKLARELKVVMPISFYEKDGNVLYNSIQSMIV